MKLPEINQQYLQDFLVGLLNIPSPTGFAEGAMLYCQDAVKDFPGITISRDRKGGMLATWQGKTSDPARAVTSHVDTLGAIVKEIKANGRLRLTNLGGVIWPSVENEGLTVFTTDGKQFRGSLVLTKASGHVYPKECRELPRNDETMEVRLDERTTSADETRKLGIEVGDFVAFDTRIEIHNGFIRSRYHDDKACVACVVAAVKAITEAGLQPAVNTYLHFSNYEEVGHGGSAGIPEDAAELLAVDMAAIGEGQNSDEFHTSICIKDASGPYHHGFSQRLRRLADSYEIPYKVDTYHNYASDGSALWRAGGNIAIALIGPGIDGSHSYERAHMDGLLATTNWIMAYLLN